MLLWTVALLFGKSPMPVASPGHQRLCCSSDAKFLVSPSLVQVGLWLELETSVCTWVCLRVMGMRLMGMRPSGEPQGFLPLFPGSLEGQPFDVSKLI